MTGATGDIPPRYPIVIAAVVAWLCMYVHNMADLPNLTFLSPENMLPAIVWLVLLTLWWILPDRRIPANLLLAWGLLNLLGGFLTVLPLPILPFKPEQSLRHYLFHVLYAAAQVPLVYLARAARRVTS